MDNDWVDDSCDDDELLALYSDSELLDDDEAEADDVIDEPDAEAEEDWLPLDASDDEANDDDEAAIDDD